MFTEMRGKFDVLNLVISIRPTCSVTHKPSILTGIMQKDEGILNPHCHGHRFL